MLILSLLRPYSFEALAVLFTLSDTSYFLSVASDKDQALRLCIEFVDKVLMRNSCRGQEGTAPMNHQELRDLAKELAAEAGLQEHLLRRAPDYSLLYKSSSSSSSGSKQDRQQDRTKKDINAAGLTRKERLDLVCANYNSGNCNNGKRCQRQHKCSEFLPDGTLCAKDHPRVRHE